MTVLDMFARTTYREHSRTSSSRCNNSNRLYNLNALSLRRSEQYQYLINKPRIQQRLEGIITGTYISASTELLV